MSIIEEDSIRFVAAADVTDDCRVESVQRKRRMTFTPSQARHHARALIRYADEAERAVAELVRPTEPAAVDLVERMSPDCKAGKHPASWQDMAWNDALDTEVPCECPCHRISTSGRAA